MLAAVCLVISMFATNVLTLYFTIGIGTGNFYYHLSETLIENFSQALVSA